MSERLHAAAERLAEVTGQMYDAGHALGGLQCSEIEAIADVLRAIDATEAADCIVKAHGENDDDPYDQHHDIYLTAEGRADEIAEWRAELRRETARETADLLRNSRGDTDALEVAAAAFDEIAEGRA